MKFCTLTATANMPIYFINIYISGEKQLSEEKCLYTYNKNKILWNNHFFPHKRVIHIGLKYRHNTDPGEKKYRIQYLFHNIILI